MLSAITSSRYGKGRVAAAIRASPAVERQQSILPVGETKGSGYLGVEKVGEKKRCNVCGNEAEVTEVSTESWYVTARTWN